MAQQNKKIKNKKTPSVRIVNIVTTKNTNNIVVSTTQINPV